MGRWHPVRNSNPLGSVFSRLNPRLLQGALCSKVANLVCSDYVFVVSNAIYMPVTQSFRSSAKILPPSSRPLDPAAYAPAPFGRLAGSPKPPVICSCSFPSVHLVEGGKLRLLLAAPFPSIRCPANPLPSACSSPRCLGCHSVPLQVLPVTIQCNSEFLFLLMANMILSAWLESPQNIQLPQLGRN